MSTTASDGKDSEEMENEKTGGDRKWGSKVELIVVMIGSSMGTSDVWRFPYLVLRNGGGAFLIPFLLVMVVCCIPLYFLELAMSQFSAKSCYRVWDLCPLFRGIGVAVAVLNLVDIAFASVIRVWIFEYIVQSFSATIPWITCDNAWNTARCIALEDELATNVTLTNTSTNVYGSAEIPSVNDWLENVTYVTGNSTSANDWLDNVTYVTGNSTLDYRLTAAEEFWQYKILNISSGLEDVGEFRWEYIIYLFVFRCLVGMCLVKSVKTIGKVMYVTTLVPIVLLLIMWIRSLLLPGSANGMLYFITPDFSKLASIEVWIEAGFMAFYTLGTGWGSLLMIGAHNKFRTNCLQLTVIATIADVLASVISGLVVFSVLGIMAHETGQEVKDVIHAGMSVSFVAFPRAMAFLPLTQLWAVLFFLVILMVSFDAQMMMIEIALSCIEEVFPRLLRKRVLMVAVTSLALFVVAIPTTAQNGAYLFQLMDWYVATFSCQLIAVLECLAFFWFYGGDRISHDVEMMLGRPLPAVIRFCSAFVSPVFLSTLLLVSIVKYVPPKYGNYVYPAYARGLGWCTALASIIPLFLVPVVLLAKGSGSFKQRISDLTSSTKAWGPGEVSLRPDYQAIGNDRSSTKEILKFNLLGLGRPRKSLYLEKNDMPEMEQLTK